MAKDSDRRKLYRDAQRPQCSGLLKLRFPVQCSRRASVKRNDRFYCGQHDPLRDRRYHRQTNKKVN